MNVDSLAKETFKRVIGVNKEAFDKILEIVEIADKVKKRRGGKKDSKISIKQRLLITLEYYKLQTPYLTIGVRYGISEGYVCKIVHWVERVLRASGEFDVIFGATREDEILVVDSTVRFIDFALIDNSQTSSQSESKLSKEEKNFDTDLAQGKLQAVGPILDQIAKEIPTERRSQLQDDK